MKSGLADVYKKGGMIDAGKKAMYSPIGILIVGVMSVRR